MPGTDSQNRRVSILLKKYTNNKCSNSEALELVSIMNDPRNDGLLLPEVRNYWHSLDSQQMGDSQTIENRFELDQVLNQIHHRIRLEDEKSTFQKSFNTKLFTVLSKYAAVLILPLLVYSIYLTFRGPVANHTKKDKVVWHKVKATVGMQADIILPDGSHVWLNSGSVLNYPDTFTDEFRQVTLSGEAFFDIVKDEVHPFLVKAGKMHIEVKGTRFNVINYPDETVSELILESGSVRIFSGNLNENKIITNVNPGELAVFDTVTNKLTISNVDVRKYTSWKDGVLIFRDDHMEDVVRKLNKWFNVEIILQSPELKEYVYTATYRDETLPQILELLKISAPIKYDIADRERLSDNSYSKRKIIITKRK